jgi:hypothetical protein
MAQELQNITIAAPGFAGLNTQDSPIDMPPVFASVADNCVIDQFGRIGARKGFDVLTTVATPLGTSVGIEAIGQYVTDAGVATVFSAGNNKIFTGTTTLTDVTPGSYTITTNNWKIENFNDKLYLFQRGYEPLVYNGTTLAKMSAVGGAAGTPPQANEVLAAFGRLFVADFSTDKSTVYWSDLLNGTVWTGGSSGSIDLTTVWPNGYDEIVALASHNSFLIIFGKRSILIYSGADDPSTMVLHDTVNGIGCISRDSVASTGQDILFLDYTGIRSLGRTVQEKSVPIGDLSKNVRDVFNATVSFEASDIKCHYNPENAFYLVNLKDAGFIYCFDTRRPLEDGSYRATRWRGSVLCFARMNDGVFLIGVKEGIAEYTGFTDNNASYTLSYFSHPLTFGASSSLKMLKKVNLTIIGAADSTGVLNWGYDFTGAYSKQTFQLGGTSSYAEYGISEYNTTAEYSVSISISKPRINTSGSGSAVTVGVEVPINGSSFSLQELNIHALLGRLV